MNMAARPLKDAGILITRPVDQGETLKARFEAKGAEIGRASCRERV